MKRGFSLVLVSGQFVKVVSYVALNMRPNRQQPSKH